MTTELPSKPITSTTVLLGLENVGKTQLLASLVGKLPMPENFRGSTLTCDRYRQGNTTWIDTPGLHRESETATTAAALEALKDSDRIALIVRANHAREELATLLPLAANRPGFLIITFADALHQQVPSTDTNLFPSLNVPTFLVDARTPSESVKTALQALTTAPISELTRFPASPPKDLPNPFTPASEKPSLLAKITANPLIALILLFLPAIIAVTQANRIADALYDPLASLIAPILSNIATWPSLPAALFGGDYGVIAMLPFLILYAAPTILVFSLILAFYKSTGLIEKISVALHPFLRPFGIGGRDLVRVVMGFGCNVPAIISTRACSSCSRGACVSAISFGSACSYQLPATLAVFAAAGIPALGLGYLAILAITTLIYLRFTTPKALRLATNKLLVPKADPLRRPSWRSIWRETTGTLHQFVVMAFPIFIGICFVAAILAWSGALDAMAFALTPLMAIFNLPGDAATAVVLGSIRKDGLAIGLLDNDWGTLKVALTTPTQVLTATYLAGVLLPCLVTLVTIGREIHWKFAAKLCARQAGWAAAFAILIAWTGYLIF